MAVFFYIIACYDVLLVDIASVDDVVVDVEAWDDGFFDFFCLSVVEVVVGIVAVIVFFFAVVEIEVIVYVRFVV